MMCKSVYSCRYVCFWMCFASMCVCSKCVVYTCVCAVLSLLAS